jgi:hypothetical protein
VILDPQQREQHVRSLLKLDGLEVREDTKACYCALPLTGAAPEMRKLIEEEHDKIKACISRAGLRIYDPKDSGTNPWIKLEGKPQDVYDLDTIQVVTPRFFEFTNLYPSTGAGIEEHKAISYVKIPVIVTKSGMYTSRMSNGARRVILIEYENADSQQDDITGVFKTLGGYEPGIGLCSMHGNTLIGFCDGKDPLCLPGLVASKFSGLAYNFDKYLTL